MGRDETMYVWDEQEGEKYNLQLLTFVIAMGIVISIGLWTRRRIKPKIGKPQNKGIDSYLKKHKRTHLRRVK